MSACTVRTFGLAVVTATAFAVALASGADAQPPPSGAHEVPGPLIGKPSLGTPDYQDRVQAAVAYELLRTPSSPYLAWQVSAKANAFNLNLWRVVSSVRAQLSVYVNSTRQAAPADGWAQSSPATQLVSQTPRTTIVLPRHGTFNVQVYANAIGEFQHWLPFSPDVNTWSTAVYGGYGTARWSFTLKDGNFLPAVRTPPRPGS
jgi:hypothetical protein